MSDFITKALNLYLNAHFVIHWARALITWLLVYIVGWRHLSKILYSYKLCSFLKENCRLFSLQVFSIPSQKYHQWEQVMRTRCEHCASSLLQCHQFQRNTHLWVNFLRHCGSLSNSLLPPHPPPELAPLNPGRVSFFSSGSENLHRVEKVTWGTRYAITVSFTCNPEHAIADPTLPAASQGWRQLVGENLEQELVGMEKRTKSDLQQQQPTCRSSHFHSVSPERKWLYASGSVSPLPLY